MDDCLAGVLFFERVADAQLGANDKCLGARVADEGEYLRRRTHEIGQATDVAGALGVDQHEGVGMLASSLVNLLGQNPVVRRAVARPEDQFAIELLRNVVAQALVGHEEHRHLSGDRLDHAHRVGAGAADVAQGLGLGAGVDVADDLGFRMPSLGLGELPRGNHVGHRAPRVGVGNEHRAVGVDELGRLGHEGDAAQDDCLGRFDRGRLLGQGQRVAHEVGNVLHCARLVVVSHDDGMPLVFQLGDASGEPVINGRCGSSHLLGAPVLFACDTLANRPL